MAYKYANRVFHQYSNTFYQLGCDFWIRHSKTLPLYFDAVLSKHDLSDLVDEGWSTLQFAAFLPKPGFRWLC